jgi:hypothetical protein
MPADSHSQLRQGMSGVPLRSFRLMGRRSRQTSTADFTKGPKSAFQHRYCAEEYVR